MGCGFIQHGRSVDESNGSPVEFRVNPPWNEAHRSPVVDSDSTVGNTSSFDPLSLTAVSVLSRPRPHVWPPRASDVFGTVPFSFSRPRKDKLNWYTFDHGSEGFLENWSSGVSTVGLLIGCLFRSHLVDRKSVV